EAVLESESKLLATATMACRVDGDSAMPFVLRDQVVVVGESIDAAQMNSAQGTIVAIATSDGEGLLKRVGDSVPWSPHLRQFEAVGGRGSSVLLKTESIEDGQKIPLVVSCRRVLAVLY